MGLGSGMCDGIIWFGILGVMVWVRGFGIRASGV